MTLPNPPSMPDPFSMPIRSLWQSVEGANHPQGPCLPGDGPDGLAGDYPCTATPARLKLAQGPPAAPPKQKALRAPAAGQSLCRPIGASESALIESYAAIRYKSSLQLWHGCVGRGQPRCCRKPLTRALLRGAGDHALLEAKRIGAKPDRSHAERSEIRHDVGGDRGIPGLAGRVLEHDARFEPQPQPKVDAMARRVAVSRHHDCHDPFLLFPSVRESDGPHAP